MCTLHLFVPRPGAHPAVHCRWQKYFGKWATLTFQTNVFCLLYSLLCCASGESSWHPGACIPRVIQLYPDEHKQTHAHNTAAAFSPAPALDSWVLLLFPLYFMVGDVEFESRVLWWLRASYVCVLKSPCRWPCARSCTSYRNRFPFASRIVSYLPGGFHDDTVGSVPDGRILRYCALQ